jgi:hypothetical protein
MENKVKDEQINAFLSDVLTKGFELCELEAKSFMSADHFPPEAIMEALRNEHELRVNILVAAGLVQPDKRKTAMRWQPADAARDLTEALRFGDTDERTILEAFPRDERVRTLDRRRVWAFVTENKFWARTGVDGELFERANRFVTFVVDCAIENALVTHHEVVDALNLEQMIKRLPNELLGRAVMAADMLDAKFSRRALLTVWPPDVLVGHMGLNTVWEKVISVVEKKCELTEAATADVTPDTQPHAEPLKENDAPAPVQTSETAEDDSWLSEVIEVPPSEAAAAPEEPNIPPDAPSQPSEPPEVTVGEAAVSYSLFPPEPDDNEGEDLTRIATRPDDLPDTKSPSQVPDSEFDAARDAASIPPLSESESTGVSLQDLARRGLLDRLQTVEIHPHAPDSVDLQTLEDLVTVFCDRQWIEGDETRAKRVMTEALMALDAGALPNLTRDIGLTTRSIAMTFDQAVERRFPGLSKSLRQTSPEYKSMVAPGLPGLGKVALPPKRKGKGPPPLPGTNK